MHEARPKNAKESVCDTVRVYLEARVRGFSEKPLEPKESTGLFGPSNVAVGGCNAMLLPKVRLEKGEKKRL